MSTSSTAAVRLPTGQIAADKWVRVAGYFIDVIPAIFLALVGLIPIAGPILAGLLLTPYWLLRDVFGVSLGKLLLGTRIVMLDGRPAPAGARVLRNLPLMVGPALLLIPLLGYFLGPSVTGIIVFVEGILVLSNGSRIGDRLAGTVIVKR